ncbi:MAG: TIGR02186 family protein [Rhizobiaceae bacterium]|nr:TIGR02186 family protein [Rhizobiaceae bacterium]
MAWLAAGAMAQSANPEGIQIGLSTDVIRITTDFAGEDLTIFGSLENPDVLTARQSRYDVVVVLEGPARPVTVRRKDRILGIWINTLQEGFVGVPESYSIATTRMPQDITDPNSYRQLALGIDYLHVQPVDRERPETLAEFTAALRERKRASGLYSERIGGVQFLSTSLFRATLSLAPNVPIGTHKARAFLFKNGLFVKETSAQLAIVKSGFEQTLYRLSTDHGFFFGICAVVLAIVTGWLGRIIFKRD